MATSRFGPWDVVPDAAEAARWFAPALRAAPWGVVRALVPERYPCYARLLHPAYRERPEGRRTVRWQEIAEHSKRVFSPSVQFPNLVGLRLPQYENGIDDDGRSASWTDPPAQGTLPPELVGPVVDVLRGRTSTADDCFFALWSGWTATRGPDIADGARLRLPDREYLLFRGSIDTARHSVFEWTFQTMNLWWPADRRWFLATDIDLESTYLGIDEDGMRALADDGSLEVLPAAPDQGVTTASDTLNPAP